nr:leucine-rich repeat domain-containing protein [Paludibacteraceae bacterium]
YAFAKCESLTSFTIPNSVISIGDYAFCECNSLTSVSIPNKVTAFGKKTFANCKSLTSVAIGNKVTSIEYGAFDGCSSLTDIILGSSVKVLEKGAFYGCQAIKTITCYSMRPPTVKKDDEQPVFPEDMPYSTIIYVPADYWNTYALHDIWGLYDVQPIGASGTQTDELQITPDDNTADIVWPSVDNAATYELVIKDKGGNVICTLVFNAKGQLTSIAFNAPDRDRSDMPEQAQSAGFSFTVTGLDAGTSYNLTMTAKDSKGDTIDEKEMSFTTKGGIPTSVDDVQPDNVQTSKVFRNGQILILRGDKTYTLQGQEVK